MLRTFVVLTILAGLSLLSVGGGIGCAGNQGGASGAPAATAPGTAASSAAQAALAPWKDFDLVPLQVGDRTIYCERSLLGHAEFMKTSTAKFFADSERRVAAWERLGAKKEEIIDEVNGLLGFTPTEAQRAEQRETLEKFVSMGGGMRTGFGVLGRQMPFGAVSGKTFKEYLRGGGTLPGCSYDPATGQCIFKFGFKSNVAPGQSLESATAPGAQAVTAEEFIKQFPALSGSGVNSGVAPALACIMPIPPDGFEECWQKVFDSIRTIFGYNDKIGPSGAIHEVTEMTMVRYRLRVLMDGRTRWFQEGMANAVALRLTREHLGQAVADEFAAANDPSGQAKLEKQINLGCWLPENWCIKTPLASEAELEQARYAFATREAARLMEAHGPEVLAKILDCAQHEKNRGDLCAAIKEATGEDMTARLARYQAFATAEEGRQHYAVESLVAQGRDELEAALSARIRVSELRTGPDSDDNVAAAHLLWRLGYHEAADQAILQLAVHFNGPEELVVAHSLFINFAGEYGDPARASPSAEIVLAAKPDYLPAQAVRMAKLAADGKMIEAKTIARHIATRANDKEKCWEDLANSILAR
jgi:hypothetical protein